MALEGMLTIRESVPASADLSAHQYKIVEYDGSSELALSATGGNGGFILLDKPNAKGVNGTILLAGKGKVIFGDTVAAGAFLTNEVTTGHAITATTGDAVIGVALEAGVDGDLGKVYATQSAIA